MEDEEETVLNWARKGRFEFWAIQAGRNAFFTEVGRIMRTRQHTPPPLMWALTYCENDAAVCIILVQAILTAWLPHNFSDVSNLWLPHVYMTHVVATCHMTHPWKGSHTMKRFGIVLSCNPLSHLQYMFFLTVMSAQGYIIHRKKNIAVACACSGWVVVRDGAYNYLWGPLSVCLLAKSPFLNCIIFKYIILKAHSIIKPTVL